MISSGKSSEKIEVSCDIIFSKDISIVQHKNGYRFNSDSMILSWFVHEISLQNQIKNALEIGAGSGVVSIVLKKRGFKSSITCVEVQEEMFSILSENISNNHLKDSVFPVCDDFRTFANNEKCKFDLIFSNPPFFGTDSGKINKNNNKAISKHEFFGNLNDFFCSSVKILRQNGHFVFIYPISRIQYALQCAGNCGLTLSNICFFRENCKAPPHSFAAHLILKSSESNVLSELITMKDLSGEYSPNGMKIMYGEVDKEKY